MVLLITLLAAMEVQAVVVEQTIKPAALVHKDKMVVLAAQILLFIAQAAVVVLVLLVEQEIAVGLRETVAMELQTACLAVALPMLAAVVAVTQMALEELLAVAAQAVAVQVA
jgi:hypothetical protein